MRIAIWHNLPSGGGKRALYHHVKGLTSRGHHVEAWCPSTADAYYLPLSGLCKEHRLAFDLQYGRRHVFDRVPWCYRKTIAALDAMDVHCRGCAQEIARGRFDVLFANSCRLFRATAIGSVLPQFPSLLYLQEPYRPLYEALPRLPWEALQPRSEEESRRQYAVRWVKNVAEVQGLREQVRQERVHAEAFGRILVNSQFSRESVRRAYGLDSEVCYLGVDAERFGPLNLPREPLVICVGGLYPGKGAETTICAIGAIPQAIRPRLMWIGNFASEGYRQDVCHLAGRLQVDFGLRVMVSDEELVEWLNRAMLMVYTPVLEPFGFAPLEANACETPVVAIAEGGIRETVVDGENGLLVGSRRPELLAAAIARLLEHRDEARTMGRRGREQVLTRWTWGHAVERLEQHLVASMGGCP